jgi:hypothetical protein
MCNIARDLMCDTSGAGSWGNTGQRGDPATRTPVWRDLAVDNLRVRSDEAASDPTDHLVQSWRTPLSLRLTIIVGYIGFTIAAVLDSRNNPGPWLPYIQVDVAAALFFYGLAFAPVLRLSSDRLEIRNLWHMCAIDRRAVVSARPTYWGLVIVARDGRVRTARAAPKSNWQTWLKRNSRADRIADQIMAWAREV